jgi:hypothetical protein
MKKINSIILAVLVAMAIPLAAFAQELGITSLIAPGETADVVVITSSGTTGGVFTVPKGQRFIITDVIIFPQIPGTGTDKVFLVQNGTTREVWTFPNSGPFQAQFITGLAIAPEFSLSVENAASSTSAIRRVLISGFLK